jgi:hypothetical protein
MPIPFIAFLGLYLIAVFIVLLFGISSLYHLLRFGFFSPTSITMTFIMLAGTALLMFISYRLLIVFDWSQSFDVWVFIISLKPF